ncbi:DrmB family protein [Sorangium sp. So ce385]|uniref:DrmB family protein n=1 Tax=Sorangium sp. So ce385 TaxID=3133308 RepID=UPI003F5BFF0C
MAARKPRSSGSPKARIRPEGQVRRSQVLTTFGPGALVDFPKHAAIMGGLESWGDPDKEGFQQVFEERLEAALRAREQNPRLRLFAPPSSPDALDAPARGITAFEFPEWFIEQPPEGRAGEGGFRSRRLLHRRAIERGSYGKVVPIRFVRACPNGHIGDIDWRGFAHGGRTDCTRELFLDERGTSGDLADIMVRCACKASRSLVDATLKGDQSPLGPCWGETPWLADAAPGDGEKPACVDEQGKPVRNKLLVRSATNAYFPQNVSAISIPTDASKQALREAIEAAWGDLESAEGEEDVARELKKPRYKHLRDRFSAPELWAEVQRKRSGTGEERRGIKAAELDTFLTIPESAGEDTPDKQDFFAHASSLAPARRGAMALVSRVVLVHRMREVSVQLGFTRFEAPARDVDYELSLGVRTAPLAREVTWLPAVENRGEGIFLALDPGAVARWRDRRPQVEAREQQLIAGFDAWKKRRQAKNARFPGVTYVMLHSLSHLLLTAVSLECGYAASSIRERIYLDGDRCGILLFTGTPDAEGTLGGLVQVGKKLAHHLDAALDLGKLCSNDPVCAQHHPDDAHEERFLHGAACHGCLLISEPSCEWSNELLDRSLVVDTVEDSGAAFFTEA